MTTVYQMPLFPANQRPPRHLRGLGTAHRGGPNWTLAVRNIRAAVLVAREHAPTGRVTAESVADAVIDRVDQMKPRDLAVLAATLGILFRASKN